MPTVSSPILNLLGSTLFLPLLIAYVIVVGLALALLLSLQHGSGRADHPSGKTPKSGRNEHLPRSGTIA